MELHPAVLALLAALTAGVGVLGGLGGAVLLVPALVVLGVPAAQAAPLGLVSVAAGSLAAGLVQVDEGSVNHRLGVVTEVVASAGAVAGALASGVVAEAVLTRVLAVAALAAAVLGGGRRGVRNPPDPALGAADAGELRGRLGGAYPGAGGVVPYRVRRLPLGLGLMAASGLVAGLSGVGGGFVKTPATSEIMTVPVKVAAATTTFTVGITAATGLLVFAAQGRIDARGAAAVIVGSLSGGRLGAALQTRLSPVVVRRSLSAVLIVVAVVLVVTG